ncbi:hypothetical protein V6N13_004342 [Hibiscus sabdariffa]|uniref:Ripening-related protein 1 n=1 Tax=Hibiscus sabdariffa TaxID=183260 RepID=A0ABR2RZ05_9ROSI
MNKKACCSALCLLVCFVSIVPECFTVEAHPNTCKPSGKIRGRKTPPTCDYDHGSDCCKQGKLYDIYKCSPPVSNRTEAILTLISFDNEDYGPTECDDKFHSDEELVVALSTGWLGKKKRYGRFVKIHGNEKSVKAKVVDECDSTVGCDADHGYQQPCKNNIVEATSAVWKALGEPEDRRDQMHIQWSDA